MPVSYTHLDVYKRQPVQWSSDGSVLYGYHTGELPSRIYEVAIDNGKQTLVQELRPGVPAGVVMVAPVQVLSLIHI